VMVDPVAVGGTWIGAAQLLTRKMIKKGINGLQLRLRFMVEILVQ